MICEYDALPGIDHACGHNLIAEAGVAAGLGLKAALEKVLHMPESPFLAPQQRREEEGRCT